MSQIKLKQFRTLITCALLVVVASLLMTSCKSSEIAQKEEPKKPKEISAHSIDAEEEKLLLKQTRENIKIITEVTTDTASLKKALDGQALKVFSDQLKKDLDEGKIKIRKYDSMKFKIKNYTKGVAGVRLTFKDRSYYVDKDTQEKVSEPGDKEEEFILESRKDSKRWKIFTFFTTELKEKKK